MIVPDQSSVSLTCSAEGEPIPEISWLINNAPVSGDSRLNITSIILYEGYGSLITSDLVITNITIHDTGVYSCNASNDVGYTISSGNLLVAGIVVILQ